ncbi:hypothetical protein KAR91_05965 [Candidatus Pacearchaeota archaeon]|nr:hypothetical protein [Candidatus Pacearchaeota archaeon]
MSSHYHFTAMIGMRVNEKALWETTEVEIDDRCECMKETPEEFDGSENFCPVCGSKCGGVHKEKRRTLKEQFRKYFDIDEAASKHDEEFVFFNTYKGPKLNKHTIECCMLDEQSNELMLMGVAIAHVWTDDKDEKSKPPTWPTKAQLEQYLKKLGFKPVPKTYAFYKHCRYV